MAIKRVHILVLGLAIALGALPFREKLRRPVVAAIQLFQPKATVEDRIAEYEPVVRERLAPVFKRIQAAYPPNRIILAGFKHERRLEVWVASSETDPLRLLKTYPLLGASGTLGPKLEAGDMQVPEGVYRVESLHPNSLFHLALRVDYPNAYDRAKGRQDGRNNLGSDIMIHGKTSSMGCLAMGDEAIEELFILAARTGIENISIILSPVDFRRKGLPENLPQLPDWSTELYQRIEAALMQIGGS